MTHPVHTCTDPQHHIHQKETVMDNIEAVREARTQEANDQRIAQGLTPKHCGVEVKTISHGDYECRRCGAIF